MHTIYSDGADTLDAMVAACAALGYEYIAITDHSERAGASRTLIAASSGTPARRHRAVRERYPRMTILHGVEVDIMPDGRLDFEDAVLEPLDIVLASLHDSAGQDGSRLTARCLRGDPASARHDHHASGQPARRPATGISARFRRRLCCRRRDRARRSKWTVRPRHLDLDGDHARRGHRGRRHRSRSTATATAPARFSGRCAFGIGTARRGWVEPQHVLNTRPIAEVRAFIAAKRRRTR